jgi:hypothetical protein
MVLKGISEDHKIFLFFEKKGEDDFTAIHVFELKESGETGGIKGVVKHH